MLFRSKLDSTLKELGLIRCKSDPCVYTFKNDKNHTLILAVYVDDLLIFSNQKAQRENLKSNLMKKFDMKDLGIATKCLGMNITRNVGGKRLCIDQRQYAEEVLRRFNMCDCKPVDTLLDPGLDLSIDGGL